MRSKQVLVMGLVVTLLAGCSFRQGMDAEHRDKAPNFFGVFSRGLRDTQNFSAQESGEAFSTNAPRNQVFLFAYDDSRVASKYVPALNAQAAYLVEHPRAVVMLAGHTDNRGSREYNIALGERRAVAVAEAMKLAGAKPNQIRVVSYGQERPVAYGNTEADYRRNRRVELVYEVLR